MIRSLLLVCLLAFSAWAAEPSNDDIRFLQRHVLELEQVCFHGGFQGQPRFAREQTERFLAIQATLEPVLKEHGITDEPIPRDWDFEAEDWKGHAAWIYQLTRLRRVDRCARLELAYTFAVIQLSSLEPTEPIHGFRDILFSKVTPDVLTDRRRAAWSLRYVKFVPTQLVPEECAELARETKLRWDFIFTKRKPLGYAIGMCARPMNAHYLDNEVVDNRRQEPKGWSGVSPTDFLPFKKK